MANRGWSVPTRTQGKKRQKLGKGKVLPLDRSLLTLQRHLAHGLLYMPLRDVVIAHSSRPPWDLILPWGFPSLTCQPL